MRASRYATEQPRRSAPVAGAPKAPDTCGACGASIRELGAGVVFAITERDGRRFIGEPGRGACREPAAGRIVGWVARCVRCYQSDIDHAKRGKWNYAPIGFDAPNEFLAKAAP